MRRLPRPAPAPEMDNGRRLRPPTVVSLPVRDGLRTINLPLHEAYEGLESLAREDSLSVVYDEPPSDSSTSELSVVFKGAHHSDRPVGPEVTPAGVPPSVRPAPPSHYAGAAHVRSQVPGPAAAPGHAYSTGPYPAGAHPQALPPAWSPGMDAAHSSAPPAASPGYDVLPIPSAPPLPGGLGPAYGSVHAAAYPGTAPLPPAQLPPAPHAPVVPDFDDEVDTKVMPPRSAWPEGAAVDSLQPVALRALSAPPRVVIRNDQPRKSLPGLALAAAGLLGGCALAAAALWWEGDRGELVIDVADQQCGAVEDVQIFVDEELACTNSPCTLKVSTGSHVIRAEAAGYAVAAPAAVLVDSDMPTLHKVQFGATTKTGIEVRAKTAGLNLYLDGKLVGELPKRVTGLSTGEHTLLVTGGEGYYAEERKIDLQADQLLVVEDIDLKPRTGTLRIAENSQLQSAQILLDGEPISLPFSKKLEASKRYRVQARRAGFEDFETWVEFDAADSTKDLNIQLMPRTVAASEPAADAPANPSEFAAADTEVKRRGRGRASNAEATTASRLNLLSDPPSMVLLDGKPMGQTPRMGVSVSAGTHSVLFIHPTMGRARASAKLEPGQSKTLRARF